MLLDILPFGQFREIEKNIIEATIFEGVELDRQSIAMVAAGLAEKYRNERHAILSNRVNRYSHTHEAMQALADLPNLSGMAILVYSSISMAAAGIHELYQENAKVFYSHPAAMEWLRLTLTHVDPGFKPGARMEKIACS
jgi:hypothetical protein